MRGVWCEAGGRADGGNLFRAGGRIVGQGGDVVESIGVKNARGELVMDEGGIGEVWSGCFEGLLSEGLGGAETFSVIGGDGSSAAESGELVAERGWQLGR